MSKFKQIENEYIINYQKCIEEIRDLVDINNIQIVYKKNIQQRINCYDTYKVKDKFSVTNKVVLVPINNNHDDLNYLLLHTFQLLLYMKKSDIKHTNNSCFILRYFL